MEVCIDTEMSLFAAVLPCVWELLPPTVEGVYGDGGGGSLLAVSDSIGDGGPARELGGGPFSGPTS